MNCIFKKNGSLKGENYLITIRIFNTNLIMKIEYRTGMEEVYQGVAQWLDIDSRNINLIVEIDRRYRI
jgi:hypothetical protein